MAGGNVSVGRSAPQAVHSLTHSLTRVAAKGIPDLFVFVANGFGLRPGASPFQRLGAQRGTGSDAFVNAVSCGLWSVISVRCKNVLRSCVML